jgi:predicted O-methyltransferase YrrM
MERVGIHVTPVHFYSPIPATTELSDELFSRVSASVGVDWNEQRQFEHLKAFQRYATEVPFEDNIGLSLVDAAVLHAMIRHYRPRKVVEIGGGASTRIAARACLLNGDCDLVSVEPYPNADLRRGVPGLARLIPSRIQDVPLADITDADLLFIDSSHVVRTGGDVTHELLEIVPRLKSGALVHWHDILLPGEYWKDWVRDRRIFWSEQYLLHAFLLFNSAFEIVWASRYMHMRHADAIEGVFPYFAPDHRITSFWVRRR